MLYPLRTYQIILIVGIISITSMVILGVNHYRKIKELQELYAKKEACYTSLIRYMSIAVDDHQMNTDVNEYYLKMVQSHYRLFLNYVGKKVLESIEEFICNQSIEKLEIVQAEMRKDLWVMNVQIQSNKV